MGKSPAFQFYPKDFLTDGKVITMSYAVRGIYITLLSLDWIEDGITESQFNQICGFAKSEFQGTGGYDTAIAQLLPCFSKHPTKDGCVTNPRLQKERKAQAERRADRSEAGKLGAEKRWKGKKNNKITKNGTAIKLPMAKHSSSSSSSSSSTNKNSALTSADFVFPEKLNNQNCKTLLDEFIKHRAEKKAPVTKTQIEKVLKKYAEKPVDFITNLEHSISNGYQGIFPPSNSTQKTGQSVDPRVNTILTSLEKMG